MRTSPLFLRGKENIWAAHCSSGATTMTSGDEEKTGGESFDEIIEWMFRTVLSKFSMLVLRRRCGRKGMRAASIINNAAFTNGAML